MEGPQGPLTVPSASAEITLPRADRDLLMFFASSSTAPSAPVLLTCQGIQGCLYCKYLYSLLNGSGSAKEEQRERGEGWSKKGTWARMSMALLLSP